MSIHLATPQPYIDARERNPRSLSHAYLRALGDASAARAHVRRLTRGRAANDPRAARRAQIAMAQVELAEAEMRRIEHDIEQAGGRVVRRMGGGAITIEDRRGRTIASAM